MGAAGIKDGLQSPGATRSLAYACPAKACPVQAARKVVTTAELVRLSFDTAVPQEDFPLLCKLTGEAMKKHEVVTFYRNIVEAVGYEDLHITGHSARVTGAMRMAIAGHRVWTIQVFGRWGSSAILGYVREAILGQQGGDLARVTEAARQATLTSRRFAKQR